MRGKQYKIMAMAMTKFVNQQEIRANLHTFQLEFSGQINIFLLNILAKYD